MEDTVPFRVRWIWPSSGVRVELVWTTTRPPSSLSRMRTFVAEATVPGDGSMIDSAAVERGRACPDRDPQAAPTIKTAARAVLRKTRCNIRFGRMDCHFGGAT